MPISSRTLFTLTRYDARMARWVAFAALAGVATCLAIQHAQAEEGSALRGLRPPGAVDFGPFDPYRPGMPSWTAPGDPTLPADAQPSALYGLREYRPAPARIGPSRFAYSYSDSVTGVVETGPTAQDPYSSAYAVSGQIVRSFRSGLGVGLGLRQRPAGSNVIALGVQQGWGPFRGGYTLYSGRAEAGPAPSHRLALMLDYGNRSSIGLSFTAGRDLQTGMLPYGAGGESRDWALSGYHWLAPQWALTYDVVNSDQPAYRRQGLRFGIRHTF